MSMLKKRRISSAQRTLLLATAALVFAVPCIAAAPYALHLNIAAAPIAATPDPQPAPQDSKPAAAPNADYDAGLRAGQAYAKRSAEGETQEQRAKMKAQIAASKQEFGFAYAPQPGGWQSQEEGIARKKLELKRRAEEENLTPEQREARMKMEREEMAARTRRLSELSKAAKITMQQAIDAALRQQNGTVMESALVGERKFELRSPDGSVTAGSFASKEGSSVSPMYRIVILSGDDSVPMRTIVLVNAVDGTIIKSVVE